RLADQFAPTWSQRQRPWQTCPARQLRIGPEPPRLPRLHHAREHLFRIAVQVNEQRIGEYLGKKWSAQGVLRRLFKQTDATRDFFPVSIKRASAKSFAEGRNDLGRGIQSIEPIGFIPARSGSQHPESGLSLDDAMAFATDRTYIPALRQCFEKQ